MNAYVQVFHEEKKNIEPYSLYVSLCKAIAKKGTHEDLAAVTEAFENHMEVTADARTKIA